VNRKNTGAIVLVVLAVIGTLSLVAFKACAAEAVYPVERAQQTFVRKVWTRMKGFFNGAAACAENVRLRREVASLVLLRPDLERLEAENARLRRALDYRTRHAETWQAAGVLSVGGASASSHETLRVDKGSSSGVRLGSVVVVPEGLVGRITDVTPHTSEVTLITDGSVKVSCVVETGGTAHPRGILCGGTEENLCLRHLTDAAEVPPRSQVFTSGLGGIFPKGIPVGTLLDVRRDSGGLVCEGEVLPAVDFSTLEDVFIRRDK